MATTPAHEKAEHGEHCDGCLVLTLTEENERLRADLQGVMRVLQRHQPGGSPPPGGPVLLAGWIVNNLTEAIKDIDAHALPLDTDDDGFVTGGYLISVGSLHRALALASTAPKCPECPHDASHFTARKHWRD